MLELKLVGGVPRYFLDGRPILNGDRAEAHIHGAWHRGHFRWTGHELDGPVLVGPGVVHSIKGIDVRWDEFGGSNETQLLTEHPTEVM